MLVSLPTFTARHYRRSAVSNFAGILRRSNAEQLAASARSDGLGEAVLYDSIAGLCQAVDVVCVFCPNFSRVETFEAIRDAIKAGAELKGLICEKPLARNVAEADTVLRLADEIDVPAAYFENNLFMPPITGARAQLKSVEVTMGPETRRGNRYPGR